MCAPQLAPHPEFYACGNYEAVKKCDGRIAGEKVDKDQMSFALALVHPHGQTFYRLPRMKETY